MYNFYSDLDVLEFYDYDLLSNKEYIKKESLDEIMDNVLDNDISEYYESDDFQYNDDFLKKLDDTLKLQVKDGVIKFIHALYLIYFVLLKLIYGNQNLVDISDAWNVLMLMPDNCYYNDYIKMIPLSYINKLYEIAKKDAAEYLDVSIDIFPKNMPNEWTIFNFYKFGWKMDYIKSFLDTPEKITWFENPLLYSEKYYEEQLSDKKLPEVEFDF